MSWVGHMSWQVASPHAAAPSPNLTDAPRHLTTHSAPGTTYSCIDIEPSVRADGRPARCRNGPVTIANGIAAFRKTVITFGGCTAAKRKGIRHSRRTYRFFFAAAFAFFVALFFRGGMAPFGSTMTRLPSNATTIC